MFNMSFIISRNLKPSVPLPVFANLTSPVNDINENMTNNIIATTKVIVKELEKIVCTIIYSPNAAIYNFSE